MTSENTFEHAVNALLMGTDAAIVTFAGLILLVFGTAGIIKFIQQRKRS